VVKVKFVKSCDFLLLEGNRRPVCTNQSRAAQPDLAAAPLGWAAMFALLTAAAAAAAKQQMLADPDSPSAQERFARELRGSGGGWQVKTAGPGWAISYDA
jgi:hypothetical protein